MFTSEFVAFILVNIPSIGIVVWHIGGGNFLTSNRRITNYHRRNVFLNFPGLINSTICKTTWISFC